MASLILVVISIALFAAITTLSFNYIPASAYIRHNIQTELTEGLHSLAGTVGRYFNDSRDANGNVVYPGDGVNLVPIITPAYGFLPANVRDMGWEVKTATVYGSGAAGICIKPLAPATADHLAALKHIRDRLPVNSAFLGNACGATSDVLNGAYLTYWVLAAHV